MRTLSTAAIAALTSGECIVSGAVKIAATPAFLAWGGYGPITLGGETYNGIGDRGLVNVSSAALGDSEQNVTLTLSGVDPDAVALIDAAALQRAAVAVWRLVFDTSGRTLLDAQIYTRGRLDQLPIDETIGGASTITAMVETSARGLGRSGQRLRTDADMRLVDANDKGFKAISFAGTKTLYWGGKRPSVGASLGGGNAGHYNSNVHRE